MLSWQFPGAAKVLLGLGSTPLALGQPREFQVRGARRREREACLEVVLRLAPELRGHAQAPERREQLRVLVVLAQPALGALDACARFRLALLHFEFLDVAVQRDQRAIPFRAEAALEDFAGECGLAQRS